jgi:pullulanase
MRDDRRDKYAIQAAAGHPAMRRNRPDAVPHRVAYVFMATLAGLVSSTALAGVPGAGDLRAACNAVDTATVLHAAAEPARDARAYWLDRQLVQWPGAPVEGRFRLYRSATAALRAQPGHPVAGADGSIALTPVKAKLGPAQAERARFIGSGPRFAVSEPALVQLPALMRDQVLLVREDAQGRVLEATALQTPGALDDLYAAAESATLGVHRYGRPAISEDMATRFALWAPTARAVAVCLYLTNTLTNTLTSASASTRTFPAHRDDATGVWTLDLPDALHGQHYAYLVDVFVPGMGIVRNRVTDPYSVGLTADSKRSVALDLDNASTKPEGWDDAARPAPLASPTDMTIYELHVRDFSIGDKTVRPEWRGKYLAFTETDTAGMRHLRALGKAGMTDVHLLPVFDLATIPERDCLTPTIPAAAPDSEAQQTASSAVAAKDCFNWGYDPYHFNAPEGSYATDPDDGAGRVREFRAMVLALHAAGLRVGMDVVYNHTTTAGQAPTSVLDRIVPGYYQRLDANGRIERSTCCENTATEHRMMAKLMIESAALWAQQYRIDSFRFDLMGHQPREAMERLQRAVDAATGRRIDLIGEGWNFGEIANGARFVQASQLSLNDSGIATFSDRARDALRGGGCCDSGEALLAQGLLSGLHYAPNAMAAGKDQREALLRAADMARIGLAGTLRDVRMTTAAGETKRLADTDYAGQPAGYAAQPGEVVNYVENHDNPTLFDILALKLPRETTREDRARVQLLGAAFVGFSQGIAYYHAGMEVLRSKSLDRNSYDSGDWFNRLDWTYTDNGFGAGLPPARDNGKDWALLKPVLADPSIKPHSEQIVWMREAFNDVLKIRGSSTLFRMRTANDVETRLTFRNIGPEQNPVVIAAHLDGAGYAGAGFREILYFLNVSPDMQTLTLPEEKGKAYALHPVQRAADAADTRPVREARYDARSGRFTIPARSAVVYVVP